jgi:hypothetical protein
MDSVIEVIADSWKFVETAFTYAGASSNRSSRSTASLTKNEYRSRRSNHSKRSSRLSAISMALYII